MDPLLLEMFGTLPRQGPGNFQTTEKAFSYIKDKLPDNPTILDIGCGTGAASFSLCKLKKSTIYALDNHAPFIEEISKNPISKSCNIKPLLGDMMNLKFPEGQLFDAIWSEGSSFICGFEYALANWKKFIKPHGFLAISDMAWFKKPPYPAELEKFFKEAYPTMPYVDDFLPIISKCDYTLISHFNIPTEAWWDPYYTPMEKYIQDFFNKHKNDPKISSIFNIQAQEIQMFKKYSDYYGYTFFIMQKNN